MDAKQFLEDYKIIERTDLEFRCKVKSKDRFILHDIETKTLEQLMDEYALRYHESEVKKLNLLDVSSQRELLLAFAKFWNKESYEGLNVYHIDKYLESKQ